MLANGLGSLDAGSAGAFIHGLAGLFASGSPPVPITALDVAEAVPDAIAATR
jgi:NAD(P)H-hydrate repair Nnr-like enzyme with NAD(P)H-hydrate dehydratase domain